MFLEEVDCWRDYLTTSLKGVEETRSDSGNYASLVGTRWYPQVLEFRNGLGLIQALALRTLYW